MSEPVYKTLKGSAISKDDYDPLDDIGRKERQSMKLRYPSINFGKWTAAEKTLYLNFLIEHRDEFAVKDGKRNFKKMEAFIKTRCSDQCRSRHQKIELEAKSSNIDDIIKLLIEKENSGSEKREKMRKKKE